MNRVFRIFVVLIVGLFLVGVTGTTNAGITSKVKKTAKKGADKAKDTAKKGAEKTNDTVHKGADKAKDTAESSAHNANKTVTKGATKVRDNKKIQHADKQAKGEVDGLTDVFKEIVK